MAFDPEADPRPTQGGAAEYQGSFTLEYAPEVDGEADPGEIVWTWVPYEEDPAQGKDRPVVVVGRADELVDQFAVLMVSSRDRSGYAGWVAVGSGDWDRDHRPSYVRTDRMLAVAPAAVRREGAALTPAQYQLVVEHL